MKNRKPYSIVYKLLWRVPMSVGNVLIHIKPWVINARTNSYYKDRPLKSKIQILIDHLSLAFRHGHTFKDDYFAMGIDQKGKNVKDYICEAENTLALYAKNTARGLPSMKWHYDLCSTLKDKWVFAQMCRAYKIPIPKTYGLVMGGKIYSEEFTKIDDFLCEDFDVMFKPIDGASGIGIFHLLSHDGHLFLKGKEISIKQLREKLKDGKYLVQQFINNQHEGMSRLYQNACNSLRITVAREGDDVRVLGRMCMLGAHGTDCSNWHFGGVSVNLKEDGTLDKFGFCKIDKRIDRHPDSGVIFEGYKIPFFDEAIELAKYATKCFYGFCSIGWDVAITTDGPILLEGNDSWGIVAHQMVENTGWMQKWEHSHGDMNM